MPVYDLMIIGAGINGAAIARDAAGRGLSVLICDQGDIGGATSSASSKMIHGGLRYLEHYEFRLVAEALAEREVMLRIAPHLTRPLQIVMPHVAGLRPAWMIRLGLVLYDSLGRLRERTTLPRSRSLDLRSPACADYAAHLCSDYRRGYLYADVLDDDARLTLATVRDAAERGATVLSRSPVRSARRLADRWQLEIERHGQPWQAEAHLLVNAAGPWAGAVLQETLAGRDTSTPSTSGASLQLIRGSHIVVPRFHAGTHGYLLQNVDQRVVFVLPFEQDFTLIGTTEVRVDHPGEAQASPEEIDYLCAVVRRFFKHPLQPTDVCWQFAGLRPLYDDGHGNPGEVTRDYRFVIDVDNDHSPIQPVLLSIFGGKLTTHRRLAEAALEKLAPWLPRLGPAWTHGQPLPGGDFEDFEQLHQELCRLYPRLPADWLQQLARRHGSRCRQLLGSCQTLEQLGSHFGGGLYQREVEYSIAEEWACTAEDLLWRRSKAGLRMTAEKQQALAKWLKRHHPELPGDPT